MVNPISLTNLKVKQLSFEATLKGTGAINDPAFLQELKSLYNVEKPQLSYSPETFQKFLDLIRERCYPDLPVEQGFFEVGRKSFHGYMKGTIVGRVALAAIHIMGPSKVVMMARLWDDSGLGQAETKKIGERKYQTEYRNFLLLPPGIAGVAVESVTVAGAKNTRYQIVELPTPAPYIYNCNIIYEWD